MDSIKPLVLSKIAELNAKTTKLENALQNLQKQVDWTNVETDTLICAVSKMREHIVFDVGYFYKYNPKTNILELYSNGRTSKTARDDKPLICNAEDCWIVED